MSGRECVHVEFPRDEPSYDSFAAAVRSTQNDPRAARAEADTKRVVGSSIVGYSCADDELSLLFSNDSVLRIGIAGAKVSWSVLERRACGFRGTKEPAALYLQFPSGNEPHHWDRNKLLRDRLNKDVTLVSASKSWVFLYVGGCDGLMFSRMILRDTGASLLFYEEE